LALEWYPPLASAWASPAEGDDAPGTDVPEGVPGGVPAEVCRGRVAHPCLGAENSRRWISGMLSSSSSLEASLYCTPGEGSFVVAEASCFERRSHFDAVDERLLSLLLGGCFGWPWEPPPLFPFVPCLSRRRW
jgi:hypothetical protein